MGKGSHGRGFTEIILIGVPRLGMGDGGWREVRNARRGRPGGGCRGHCPVAPVLLAGPGHRRIGVRIGEWGRAQGPHSFDTRCVP